MRKPYLVLLGKSHIYIANSCIVRYCRKNLLLSKNVATVSIFFAKPIISLMSSSIYRRASTWKNLFITISNHLSYFVQLFVENLVCSSLSLCYYLGREVIFCISCYRSGVGWHTMSRVRFIMPSKKNMMKQWLSRSSFK